MMTLRAAASHSVGYDDGSVELGIADNDWVEIYNDNGVVSTRRGEAASRGACLHSVQPPERRSACRERRPGAPEDSTTAPADPTQAGPHGRAATRSSPTTSTTGDPTEGSNRDTTGPWPALPMRVGRHPHTWTSAARSRWSSTSTSASAATPARSRARTSGPIARAPSTCGGTTSRPSPAPAPTKWEEPDVPGGGWEGAGSLT